MDYALATNIDRMAAAHQRWEDDQAEAQDRAEKLREKAAQWLNHADNVFEISGWFSEEQYAELARLDALINHELSRPYSGKNMSEIEVGIREYAEEKREIFIDCAVQYADQFDNFEDGVQR